MDAQLLGSLAVFLQIIDEESFIGIDVRLPDYLLIDVGIRNTKVLELNPGQLLPNSLERTMGVILEPEVGEEALYYHHGDAHKESVGDAELRLEIKAIISKQSATDNRLEEVVGQTHLTKLAQERQSLSEPFLSIPQKYET